MSRRFRVYADFNCPFCYALDVRLTALGSDDQVDWHPVEHAPQISSRSFGLDDMAELASEVFTVRHRPPACPSASPPRDPRAASPTGSR